MSRYLTPCPWNPVRVTSYLISCFWHLVLDTLSRKKLLCLSEFLKCLNVLCPQLYTLEINEFPEMFIWPKEGVFSASENVTSCPKIGFWGVIKTSQVLLPRVQAIDTRLRIAQIRGFKLNPYPKRLTLNQLFNFDRRQFPTGLPSHLLIPPFIYFTQLFKVKILYEGVTINTFFHTKTRSSVKTLKAR